MLVRTQGSKINANQVHTLYSTCMCPGQLIGMHVQVTCTYYSLSVSPDRHDRIDSLSTRLLILTYTGTTPATHELPRHTPPKRRWIETVLGMAHPHLCTLIACTVSTPVQMWCYYRSVLNNISGILFDLCAKTVKLLLGNIVCQKFPSITVVDFFSTATTC